MTPRPQSLLGKFLIWRVRHVRHRHFVLIVSMLVGLFSGLGAVTIKNCVHFIQELLTSGFSKNYHNYLYFAYPVIGILVTVLFIKYILKKRIVPGIPATLFAISKKNSIMPRHDMFSSLLTGALTVGFGGSAGLEGPTVATGSSVGSNIGRMFRLNYKTTTLLIGCGVAGSMAGIFNAPIAAIVFALEVIMLDLTMASLIPLLVASVVAALTSQLLIGNEVLFHFDLKDSFVPSDVPFYMLLGVLTGLVSVYFSKTYWAIEKQFEKIRRPYKKWLIGSSLLGVLIFLIPPLYGEGYGTINKLLSGNYGSIVDTSLFFDQKDNIYLLLVLLLIMMLFKVIATSITFGAGGIGGVFAPTLFMGSTAGFVFAKVFNVFGWARLSESNFTLVGMAGMIAGVLHAPLTAIFLIAEITSGYELFIPLMIAASIAYMTVKYFVPRSIYTMQLAKRGELITHHKDKAVLTRMQLQRVIETNFTTVYADTTLGELVKAVASSNRNFFPVTEEDGTLLGVVTLDAIRDIMFEPAKYDNTYVSSLMHVPQYTVQSGDSMDRVMEIFKLSGAWNLTVTDKNGKYLGFVSKSKLFSTYRRMLVEFSEE